MVPFSYRESCPLCARRAETHADRDARTTLAVCCDQCQFFIIERRLAEVVANAWTRNLHVVLDRLPYLREAVQRADQDGQVLTLTTTNWMRVALAEERRTEDVRPALDKLYADCA